MISGPEMLIGLVIYLAVVIGVVLLIREIVMWYWKINRRINLMEENNLLLRRLIEKIENNNDLKKI